MTERLGREVVDDVALAAGRGALDHLAVPALEEAVELPTPLRRDPVERAFGVDARSEVERLALVRIGDQGLQRQRLLETHLVERKLLQVRVRADGLAQVFKLRPPPDRAHQRLLHRTHRLAEARAAAQLPRLRDQVLASVLRVNPRPAERPARARRHVHSEAETFRLPQSVFEHPDPLGREVLDELRLLAAHAVDGRQLQTPEPSLLVLRQRPREVAPVDGAAQPPPPRPRLRLARHARPRERRRPRSRAATSCSLREDTQRREQLYDEQQRGEGARPRVRFRLHQRLSPPPLGARASLPAKACLSTLSCRPLPLNVKTYGLTAFALTRSWRAGCPRSRRTALLLRAHLDDVRARRPLHPFADEEARVRGLVVGDVLPRDAQAVLRVVREGVEARGGRDGRRVDAQLLVVGRAPDDF